MKQNLRLILAGLGLIVVAGLVVSCGSTQSSSQAPAIKKVTVADLPTRQGEVVFLTMNGQPAPIALARGGSSYQVEVPEKFELLSNDGIQNLHHADLPLADPGSDHLLQLKPNAKLVAGVRTVTIEQGLVRLQFRKLNGEYRVVIPGATLGIRGTTFDVLVRPDQSSAVTLHEGHIVITHNGSTTDLQEGGIAEFGPGGSTLKVRLPPNVPVKTVHPDSKN